MDVKDIYDCRKIRISYHTRKENEKVQTTPMEKDQTLESESNTRHEKNDEQSYQ